MLYTQHTQQWGNGTGIRLPKKVLESAKWQQNQTVSVKVHGNSITLTPTKPTRRVPKLSELLEGVTPDMFSHSEIDWGPDVGAEIIDDDYSH